ncbi:hypothetical protein [Arthrobacter sp. MMS18-M83]|nr:hypothetical protein [Arthrobacter sp. MMS18-M83]WAH98123.1 hypothetical protein OW521_04365 [Arthrobacter sp. MMS18-M83]
MTAESTPKTQEPNLAAQTRVGDEALFGRDEGLEERLADGRRAGR